MKITLGQLVDAFSTWEQDYRSDLSRFMTPQEVRLMEVGEISAQRAVYLMALIRKENENA